MTDDFDPYARVVLDPAYDVFACGDEEVVLPSPPGYVRLQGAPGCALAHALLKPQPLLQAATNRGVPLSEALYLSASWREAGIVVPEQAGSVAPEPLAVPACIEEALAAVLARVAPAADDVLVVDQTRPSIPLHVVRVVATGLRHFWRRLAPGRLYTVPVALGWQAAPQPEAALNPIPLFA